MLAVARGVMAGILLGSAAGAGASDTALLKSGTPVLLALEHHVSSAYTPVGGDIGLRIAEDVMAGDRVVIRRGTPVRGRLRQASDRGMLGTSASMTIGVDFVPAVDGQQLRVVAAETRQGRDRGNALAGWTIFWGLPGLMTRGVHSFVLRDALLEAQVLFDRRIIVEAAPPESALPAATVGVSVARHRFSRAHAEPYRLNLERDADLGKVDFFLEWGAAAGGPAEGWSASLLAADGRPLSRPAPALEARRDRLSFDSWSVLQYCLDGTTALRFRLDSPAGERMEMEYPLPVSLSHRK